MSKKFKLFFSLASLCFSVAMLCFGVYSAMSVSYSVSGSVSYEVQDVFVDINTSLYVSTDTTLTDQGKLNSNVASFESGQVASGTEKITSYTDSLSTYNLATGGVTNPGTVLSKTSPNIPINYGSYESQTKGYAYYIVVEITNYGTEGVSVTVTNNINTTAINSLTQVSDDTTISAKSGESGYAKKYIVIGLALADATKSVDNETFDVSILIERDVVPEPTQAKLDFTLSGNSYTVSAKDNSISGTVVIPSTYNGLPVTTIGDFSECDLTKLVIPDSIVTINDDAFLNSNIPTVKYHIATSSYIFDDGMLTIGDVQNNALSVEPYIEWHPSPGEEPEHYPAWYALNPIVNKAVILDSVTALEDRSFQNCYNLKSITIPSCVTSIGKNAFEGCRFTSVTYSTSGEGYEFENGTLTIKGEVPDSPAWYKEYIAPLVTKVVFENDSITNIGYSAFEGCSSLTSITIPDSVTSIGYYAFDGCASLTEVTIPSSVTSIRKNSFEGCRFTSVTYSTSGEGYEFKNGTLTIKGEVSDTPAWYNANINPLITKVVFDNSSITSIVTSSFYNCKSLTSVTIPSSVTSIEVSAFEGCTNLTSINVDEGNQNYSSKDGVLFNKEKSTLILYPIGKIQKSYEIPNSVTSIGNNAFNSCTSLFEVKIPEGVTSIGDYAFYKCTNLTSTTIPEVVTSIGDYAFYSCANLTSITIPEGVTSIGEWVFYKCTNLTSITIPEGVTSIGEFAFYGCTNLTTVTIPEGVISIGDSAFSDCTSLTSVIIPSGVTSIGDAAFSGCTNLTTVTIPEGVTSIGRYAFYECDSLTKITIPKTVTSIGDYAFSRCTNLKSATFVGGGEWTVQFGSTKKTITVTENNPSRAATYLTKDTYDTPSGYCGCDWTKN